MDIKDKSESLVKNKRWFKRYLNFIEIFKLKEHYNSKKHHRHHILPSSLFPEYKNLKENIWNEAILNHRAHLIAHFMLAKSLGGNMWYAYNNMNCHNVKLSSKLYESGLKEFSKIHSNRMSGKNNPMFGLKRPDHGKLISKIRKGSTLSFETKEKISKSHFGKKYTNEINKKKGNKGEKNGMYNVHRFGEEAPMYGKKHSEDSKHKMSIAKKGKSSPLKNKKQEIVICPYCDKSGGKSNMMRWHFEKCKFK
jgi:hypothetical protein